MRVSMAPSLPPPSSDLPPASAGSGGRRMFRALGDDELMAACGAGDTAALAELMRRHQAAAWRYAWRIFRDHHLAEDMTQELFVKLFRNAGIKIPVSQHEVRVNESDTMPAPQRPRLSHDPHDEHADPRR